MRAALAGAAAAVALLLPTPAPAASPGDADVAALQVGLRALAFYRGDIDGLVGAETMGGLRRLSGATTPHSSATRAAFGGFGSHLIGSRALVPGTSGWDVAGLQFLLAWHGFPCGPLDGAFGRRTQAALVRFQTWAGIPPSGIARARTLGALRASPPPQSPLSLSAPITAPIGDGFGPRGDRFHTGIDFTAATGTPVTAAGDGVVVDAGRRAGGYGQIVEIEHEQGVTTVYAHLSAVLVEPGQRIARGSTVGLVGATGDATGPHLHFEVRVRGAAVDPASALG
jgi:murein DD-endopeptidase MepM/ murein hydrolase activator NlpD